MPSWRCVAARRRVWNHHALWLSDRGCEEGGASTRSGWAWSRRAVSQMQCGTGGAAVQMWWNAPRRPSSEGHGRLTELQRSFQKRTAPIEGQIIALKDLGLGGSRRLETMTIGS